MIVMRFITEGYYFNPCVLFHVKGSKQRYYKAAYLDQFGGEKFIVVDKEYRYKRTPIEKSKWKWNEL